jgi:hypothetical protein
MGRRYPVQLVLVASVTAALLAVLPNASWGNVYPTNLGQSANTFNPSAAEMVTLSYLLNEDATNVSVDILDSTNAVVRTITPGAQLKGAQSVIWDGTDNSAATLPDGDYSFRVTTTGASRASWTWLNTTENALNNFFVPRGVGINRNPDSPYYGRVYVSEGAGPNTTGAGRLVQDGLYMLNADFTDTGIPGGTGPHTGGITWASPSFNSPWSVEVGPDDSVYISDWTDSHPGLWQANPNLSGTWDPVLDNTGANAAGLNATHGSISDMIIEGTGASRTIYTIDEDWDAPAATPDPTPGSVLRYDIGTTTTFTGAPSGFEYDDTPNNYVQNFQDSITRDENGHLWISQVRSATPAQSDTVTPLMQVDGTTGTVLWRSTDPSGGGLALNTANDPLRATQAIAYDPVNNLLALGTAQTAGLVILFDPLSKTIIDQFTFRQLPDTTGSTTNTDVEFDAAGNLYVLNRSKERLRVWSPPSAPTLGYAANEFFTNSLGPLGVLTISSVPAGLPGDFNGDNVVDAADYAIWAKGGPLLNDEAPPGAGPEDYDAWAANFGATLGSGGGGGSSQVPEPSTMALAMIPMLLAAGCRRRA